MKVKLYLDKDGCERHAKGDSFYHWEVCVRMFQDNAAEAEGPANSLLLGTFEFDLPNIDLCREIAVKGLNMKLQEIRAEAYKEERETQTRIDNLLAITYTPTETSDDNPF